MKRPIKNILLVDDDEDDCMVFRMALEEVYPNIQLQFKTSCDNVAKELAILQPDILFLDINLPRVNGLECLQAIQQSSGENRIPVIMYSSSELPKDMMTSYESGAALYFRKPSSVGELIEALRNILGMDWHVPETIKKQYYKDGKYHSYQSQVV